ncbi:MAG: GAF domain-containing protein, partial [Chloroflexota bacterium]|nr:GAF domain-containing protein [Chloroflexota bacterium]
ITKPFTMSDLIETVQRALTEERLRRERDALTEQLLVSNRDLEQGIRQLKALYEVGQGLASILDLDDLLNVILKETTHALEVNVTSILLLDEDTGELVFRSGTGERAQILIGQRLALDEGVAGWVAEHSESLLVHDTRSEPRFTPIFDEITGSATTSILSVPLMVKGRAIGVVEALNKPAPGFTEDDVAMLRSLAASAAVSIENAQLFEETSRLHHQSKVQLSQMTQAYNEIQALQETIGALLSSLDVQEVLDQIVNSVVSGLGYKGAMLAEYDEENNSLPVRAIAVDPALGEAGAIGSGGELAGLQILGEEVTMDQTENLAVRAALEGKIQVTHCFHDLVRPRMTAEAANAVQEMIGARTIATIPLLVKGRLVGNMFAGSSEDEISETELDSLRTLANQAALAIENARLYQNLRESRDQVAEHSRTLEKRLSELARLQQMALELGKVTIGADMRDVFERLTEHAAALLETESSAILLYDQERAALICQEPAFGVPLEIIRDWRIPLSKDRPAWDIWESGRPLIFNTLDDHPIVKVMEMEEIRERMKLRSTMFSILRVGGEPIGALQVSDKQDGSGFTSDDERVLEIFASQSAITIENARILQRMKALNQVGEAITAHLTLSEVLERVVQGINELIKVEGISIWLKGPFPERAGDQLSLVAALPDKLPEKLGNVKLEPGEGIAGLVAQTGQPLTVYDAQNDPRCSRQIDQLVGFVTESILCVPLRVRDKISGVIEVVNKIGGKFDQEDREILGSVAASVAVAVENARLFASESRRASEMATLVEIAQAVTEAVTEQPKSMLERIALGACEALAADCAVVYPFVASESDIYDVANVATFGTLHPLELGQSQMLAGDPAHVIRKRKLLICEDGACDQPTLMQNAFFEQEEIQSFIGILLEANEDELGVLCINFRTPHHFEDRELTFVRLIAHQAALAIAKSRLFQTLDQELVRANAELRRKVRELEELQAINNIISSTLEIDKVWDSILRGAISITAAPHATILLVNEESNEVIAHIRRGDKTFTQSLDPYQTVILPSVRKMEEQFADRQDILQSLGGRATGGISWGLVYGRMFPDVRSVLHTPIVSGSDQEPIGLLVIGSPRQEEFDPDDRRLLETLANQAAIAIQNARHLETMRKFQEQKVEAERSAAMADIAGNMVHGINNTVGAIRPFVQQIEMKLARGELSDDYLR